MKSKLIVSILVAIFSFGLIAGCNKDEGGNAATPETGPATAEGKSGSTAEQAGAQMTEAGKEADSRVGSRAGG
jgi:hypothetical protein